jgi:glucose-6-phosphate isomerase
VGTNAQHAFFQLLHQGTQVVSCDFIGHSATLGAEQGDHDVLMANMFAQAQALAFGVGVDEVGGEEKLRAHRATPGNRPSNTLLFSQFTPRALGALIALYEHITFVQGVLWGVNSFDQWGVELGKRLAHQLQQDMNGAGPVGTSGTAVATSPDTYDPSTAALLAQHRRWRNTR